MSLYHETICQLSAVYPEGEAKALARMIYEERFHLSLTDILLGKDSEISANDKAELQNIVRRLLKNEPIQYVLGETEFCGLRIGVGPGVLIPRPETEELVEWIGLLANPSEGMSAQKAEDGQQDTAGASALDIGTGSGCIALALASMGLNVEAWDVSEDALRIARRNAGYLGVNVSFKRKDILQIVKEIERAEPSQQSEEGEWDIIVSNPPYVCQREADEMERNVLEYEPALALFVPDDDPLLFYRAIAHFARHSLRAGGLLFFEINRSYGAETKRMLEMEGFAEVEVRKDQFGNPRMVKAKR